MRRRHEGGGDDIAVQHQAARHQHQAARHQHQLARHLQRLQAELAGQHQRFDRRPIPFGLFENAVAHAVDRCQLWLKVTEDEL